MERSWLWRPVVPHAMEWRAWDGELVVYNEGTGSTHYLNAFGSVILLTLLEHPSGLDTAALIRNIAARARSKSAASLESDVAAALAQLAELRLAEHVFA